MPFYLMLSKLTERGRDRIKHDPDRITQVNLEIEDQGCRVVSQYALLGRYDFATLIEAPDNAHMSRLAVDLGEGARSRRKRFRLNRQNCLSRQ